MTRISCPGDVHTDPDGYAYCTEPEGTTPLAWVADAQFDTSQIEPEIAFGFFVAGFVIVGTCWAIGMGARMLLAVIRR